jgi:hypothetical protein
MKEKAIVAEKTSKKVRVAIVVFYKVAAQQFTDSEARKNVESYIAGS